MTIFLARRADPSTPMAATAKPFRPRKLGEGKPETFDFLGFTHFCTRSRKYGSFVIGRKTIKKRMRATLQAIKMELRKRMHDPIAKTGAWV
jgi:RNA-directed DNA polymerase